MQTTRTRKLLSFFLCMVLIAAMALLTTGCKDKNPAVTPPAQGEIAPTVLGEGATVFDFSVTDKDGKETAYEIHTDQETVGAALLALELIAGDDGPYGLYVKTVNGQTLDYEKDGMYWSFYVNGSYATAGVDTTKIAAGETYAFKAEKA